MLDDRADRSRSLPYRSRVELRSPDLIVAALRALPINPFERTNSRPQATFPKSHFADMNSPLNSAPLALLAGFKRRLSFLFIFRFLKLAFSSKSVKVWFKRNAWFFRRAKRVIFRQHF